jgi:2-amino-4-hydroxy-6-hydroxymethyldihydropteridine diphosphokinase
MNHVVYLGLGSNIDPQTHIARGLSELEAAFTLSDISSVYESPAIGFAGAPFLNLVARTSTELDLASLARHIRAIEYRYGRTVDCTKYSSRTIDIDILSFDDLYGIHAGICLPRPEATVNAFVLRPFAEIASDLVLPGETCTLGTLWQSRTLAENELHRVCFQWRSEYLPRRLMGDSAQMHL